MHITGAITLQLKSNNQVLYGISTDYMNEVIDIICAQHQIHPHPTISHLCSHLKQLGWLVHERSRNTLRRHGKAFYCIYQHKLRQYMDEHSAVSNITTDQLPISVSMTQNNITSTTQQNSQNEIIQTTDTVAISNHSPISTNNVVESIQQVSLTPTPIATETVNNKNNKKSKRNKRKRIDLMPFTMPKTKKRRTSRK